MNPVLVETEDPATRRVFCPSGEPLSRASPAARAVPAIPNSVLESVPGGFVCPEAFAGGPAAVFAAELRFGLHPVAVLEPGSGGRRVSVSGGQLVVLPAPTLAAKLALPALVILGRHLAPVADAD